MLVLAAIWWAWVAYSWMTNVLDMDEGLVRLSIFAVMATMLIAALRGAARVRRRRRPVRASPT